MKKNMQLCKLFRKEHEESKQDVSAIKNKTQFMARTALLLAVAIAFQYMGKYIPYNNFIVGPVVNAVLIIATAVAGLWSGTAISVIAPLVSAFTNKAPIAPLVLGFSPFIILGNFILVLFFYLFRNKNKIIGIIAGAILKFGFLFASISIFTSKVDMNEKVAETLTGLFSWSQLITALAGGAVALAVLIPLGKSLDLKKNN